jgi:hypothetical protein
MNGLEEQADNAQARDLYWKLQAFMARDHQAHIRQRCLQPSDVGDASVLSNLSLCTTGRAEILLYD